MAKRRGEDEIKAEADRRLGNWQKVQEMAKVEKEKCAGKVAKRKGKDKRKAGWKM